MAELFRNTPDEVVVYMNDDELLEHSYYGNGRIFTLSNDGVVALRDVLNEVLEAPGSEDL